ncbi:RhoGAP-domain-containing protein [Rhizopus microsporus var. microsporus]|uniref:RhoGAP-domain-containing protein n=2 Tax=Rhizopus microsporus TaxID=58291 RepID=A0A2G4SU12_RHIZD|nr:RhoGAP-domain-containing protein [Rhizopus microsporus ATCC 52813]ORE11381.1 RhoGAP-domain-containing protein [Rhizopus microsporus var. microsporus]PHZ12263.1 RhoGAP-domain-containing protein [Rhizopus microsporus ATCC 52813]
MSSGDIEVQPSIAHYKTIEKYRQQNEQYCRIIEKQKGVIKCLKESLMHLSSENESLKEHNKQLQALASVRHIPEADHQTDKRIVQHQSTERDLHKDLVIQKALTPPPKSPFRSNENKVDSHSKGPYTSHQPHLVKRPPVLNLASSNYAPRYLLNKTNKESSTPLQSSSSQLPTPASSSISSPLYTTSVFSHHPSSSTLEHNNLNSVNDVKWTDMEIHKNQYNHTPASSHFDISKNKQDIYTRGEPSTPVIPRTPRFDSLAITHLEKLTLNNLCNVFIDVVSSTVFIDEKGKGTPVFTISVYQKNNDVKNEIWKIEKTLNDIQMLDKQLKESNPAHGSLLKKLPEKPLLNAHAPAKVDERKRIIEEYLQHAVSLRCINETSLLEFLNSSIIGDASQKKCSIKEGYLTKKRKNIGGWILRYYILCNDGSLTYYENKDGQLLGTINLKNSQIWCYTANESQQDDYRHAFVLLEYKSSNNMHKHILCADSDEERDHWVTSLRNASQYLYNSERNASGLSDLSYDSEDISSPSLAGSLKVVDKKLPDMRNSLNSSSSKDPLSPRSSVSDQTGIGIHIASRQHLHSVGYKPKELNSIKNEHEFMLNPTPAAHGVFGVPLQDVADKTKISDQCMLPAIVYRCIEYLEIKGALQEEGIYRMSGSVLEIKGLKRRFSDEGDVDLLGQDQHHDLHAVAGLLKMWLRELPENIFTESLLSEYLRTCEASDQQAKIHELGRLISLLPLVNYALLRFLCAHLIRVVQNSNKNKMTLSNICVVFSATLAIPSHMLRMMLVKFDYIFWTDSCYPQENENAKASGEQVFPTEDTLKIYMQDLSSQEHLSNESTDSLALKARLSRNSAYYRNSTPKHFMILEEQLEEIDNDSFLNDEGSYYFSDGELEVAYFAERSSASSKNIRHSS